jgi:hypothetical protein
VIARAPWLSESQQQLRLLNRSLAAPEVHFHLETAANLLKLLERVSTIFSKCALKSLDNQADFDSAIRRFDPSRPSQAVSFFGEFSFLDERSPPSAGF